MKKATYYTDSGVKEQPLFVLKENKNGTVDLGLADETLVIGSCQVAAAGEKTVGHCVIEGEVEKPATAVTQEKPKADAADKKPEAKK